MSVRRRERGEEKEDLGGPWRGWEIKASERCGVRRNEAPCVERVQAIHIPQVINVTSKNKTNDETHWEMPPAKTSMRNVVVSYRPVIFNQG